MSLPFWSVVLAAGSGSRLGAPSPKQFLPLGGRPLFLRALAPFAEHADPARLVLVLPGAELEAARALLAGDPGFSPPPLLVAGGATRQESVRLALAAIPDEQGWVAVHDAARALFDGSLLPGWRRRLESLGEDGALVPVLPLADSVVGVDGERVAERLDRERMAGVQTPQLFSLPLLRRAHAEAERRGEDAATDDGGLVLAMGGEVHALPGDPGNFKITTAADLERAEAALRGPGSRAFALPRVGFAYDSHRFDPSRPLVLGGVTIASEAGGLAGHSDADVLTHALMDALLGAAALGDIGRHFPDTDPAYAGADSLELLARVLELLAERGYAPAQADLTVVAEAPRLAPHAAAIRERLAAALGLPVDGVSLKATTNEGMGALGRGEGMAAFAVAVIVGGGPAAGAEARGGEEG